MPADWQPGMPVMVPDPYNPGKMIEIPPEAFEVKAVVEDAPPVQKLPEPPKIEASLDAPLEPVRKTVKKKKKKKKQLPKPEEHKDHVKNLLAQFFIGEID